MAKKKSSRQWGWYPSTRGTGAKPDEVTKASIETKVEAFIDEVLKPKHVQPPPEDAKFNYVSDITVKWHGSSLLLIGVYTCPGPNALSPTFEARFARMKLVGKDRFDLDFMRHTGQWWPLHQGLTLDECLAAIRDDPWFEP